MLYKLNPITIQNQWHIEQWTDLHQGVGKGREQSNTFGLYVKILNSRHEVREHYQIYDGNSFIADIGGFLGLLLGHSLFGIYTMGEDYIFSGLERVFRGIMPKRGDLGTRAK